MWKIATMLGVTAGALIGAVVYAKTKKDKTEQSENDLCKKCTCGGICGCSGCKGTVLDKDIDEIVNGNSNADNAVTYSNVKVTGVNDDVPTVKVTEVTTDTQDESVPTFAAYDNVDTNKPEEIKRYSTEELACEAEGEALNPKV